MCIRDREGLEHFEEAEAANGHYSETYGLLYTYDAALAAIPEGWRLPSDADWKNLEKALGMTAEEVEKQDVWRGERQAVLLKEGEEAVSYTHLDVYKRQVLLWTGYMPGLSKICKSPYVVSKEGKWFHTGKFTGQIKKLPNCY